MYLAVGVVVVLALLLAVPAVIYARNFANDHTGTCTDTDTDTDRVRGEDGASDMRVYTDDCGTLAVRDVGFRGQFRSADLFGALQLGEPYRMRIVGVRFGPLSWFPTVLDADRVPTIGEVLDDAVAVP